MGFKKCLYLACSVCIAGSIAATFWVTNPFATEAASTSAYRCQITTITGKIFSSTNLDGVSGQFKLHLSDDTHELVNATALTGNSYTIPLTGPGITADTANQWYLSLASEDNTPLPIRISNEGLFEEMQISSEADLKYKLSQEVLNFWCTSQVYNNGKLTLNIKIPGLVQGWKLDKPDITVNLISRYNNLTPDLIAAQHGSIANKTDTNGNAVTALWDFDPALDYYTILRDKSGTYYHINPTGAEAQAIFGTPLSEVLPGQYRIAHISNWMVNNNLVKTKPLEITLGEAVNTGSVTGTVDSTSNFTANTRLKAYIGNIFAQNSAPLGTSLKSSNYTLNPLAKSNNYTFLVSSKVNNTFQCYAITQYKLQGTAHTVPATQPDPWKLNLSGADMTTAAILDLSIDANKTTDCSSYVKTGNDNAPGSPDPDDQAGKPTVLPISIPMTSPLGENRQCNPLPDTAYDWGTWSGFTNPMGIHLLNQDDQSLLNQDLTAAAQVVGPRGFMKNIWYPIMGFVGGSCPFGDCGVWRNGSAPAGQVCASWGVRFAAVSLLSGEIPLIRLATQNLPAGYWQSPSQAGLIPRDIGSNIIFYTANKEFLPERYSGGRQGGIEKAPILFEVFNEVNLPGEWGNAIDAKGYADFLVGTYQTLHDAINIGRNPFDGTKQDHDANAEYQNVYVLNAGLTPFNGTNGKTSLDYILDMYNANRSFLSSFDIWASQGKLSSDASHFVPLEGVSYPSILTPSVTVTNPFTDPDYNCNNYPATASATDLPGLVAKMNSVMLRGGFGSTEYHPLEYKLELCLLKRMMKIESLGQPRIDNLKAFLVEAGYANTVPNAASWTRKAADAWATQSDLVGWTFWMWKQTTLTHVTNWGDWAWTAPMIAAMNGFQGAKTTGMTIVKGDGRSQQFSAATTPPPGAPAVSSGPAIQPDNASAPALGTGQGANSGQQETLTINLVNQTNNALNVRPLEGNGTVPNNVNCSLFSASGMRVTAQSNPTNAVAVINITKANLASTQISVQPLVAATGTIGYVYSLSNLSNVTGTSLTLTFSQSGNSWSLTPPAANGSQLQPLTPTCTGLTVGTQTGNLLISTLRNLPHLFDTAFADINQAARMPWGTTASGELFLQPTDKAVVLELKQSKSAFKTLDFDYRAPLATSPAMTFQVLISTADSTSIAYTPKTGSTSPGLWISANDQNGTSKSGFTQDGKIDLSSFLGQDIAIRFVASYPDKHAPTSIDLPNHALFLRQVLFHANDASTGLAYFNTTSSLQTISLFNSQVRSYLSTDPTLPGDAAVTTLDDLVSAGIGTPDGAGKNQHGQVSHQMTGSLCDQVHENVWGLTPNTSTDATYIDFDFSKQSGSTVQGMSFGTGGDCGSGPTDNTKLTIAAIMLDNNGIPDPTQTHILWSRDRFSSWQSDYLDLQQYQGHKFILRISAAALSDTKVTTAFIDKLRISHGDLSGAVGALIPSLGIVTFILPIIGLILLVGLLAGWLITRRKRK